MAKDDIGPVVRAANQIASRLETKIRRLRSALKPFAEIHLAHDHDTDREDMVEGPDLRFTPKQVRAARKAMADTA